MVRSTFSPPPHIAREQAWRSAEDMERIRAGYQQIADGILSRVDTVDPREIAQMRQSLFLFGLSKEIVSDRLALACILCDNVVEATIFFEGYEGSAMRFVLILEELQQCLVRHMAGDGELHSRVQDAIRARFPFIGTSGIRCLCELPLSSLRAEDSKRSYAFWDRALGLPKTWYMDWIETMYPLVQQHLSHTKQPFIDPSPCDTPPAESPASHAPELHTKYPRGSGSTTPTK